MILNYIWAFFFFVAFIIALYKLVFLGDTEIFSSIVNSTFETSKVAFEVSLWLTGTISLWMGMLRIGEKSGLIGSFAKLVSPFFTRIFPEIPKDHPAMGPILMNFSANMLGLDNAGTPLGLKAMHEMQSLNPSKDTATNSQIMFLVLNTSGLTIIPITVLMYRSQLGAAHPSDVFIPILLSTMFSTLGGLVIVSIYQKINLFDKVIMAYLGSLLLFAALTILFFHQLTDQQVTIVSKVASNLILFSVIVLLILRAFIARINAYECFIEGAKEGFEVAVKIIPYMVAILVAIGVFRTAGGLTLLVDGVKLMLSALNLDGEFVKALPTALMKPLSGSGARGMMIDTMQTYGVDSFAGRLACTFQGATDTTLYIIAVYFGSVNIRKTRYAITCGLFADFIGIVSAIFISYLFFSI